MFVCLFVCLFQRNKEISLFSVPRPPPQPDVEALAISLSLMPEIRSELNSSVSRYNSLGWWDVYELELDNTAPWDLLMGFLREYPQICDAFTNTSHYAKLPACLNRLVSTTFIRSLFLDDYTYPMFNLLPPPLFLQYLEPRKKLIEDRKMTCKKIEKMF